MIKKITRSLFLDLPHLKTPPPQTSTTPTEKIPTIVELDYWLSPLSTEEEAREFLKRKKLLADEQDT